MARPLMPKATALWLVDNTGLTFEQIAEFCGLHLLEIQAFADGESGNDISGLNPLNNGQLTQEEIDRCGADSSAKLTLTPPMTVETALGKKKSKYTPVSKRQDKPDAIAWVIKHYSEVSDQQICRLLGTTRPTINAVRDKTHWNHENIKPKSPIQLGLCSQVELDDVLSKSQKIEKVTEDKAAS